MRLYIDIDTGEGAVSFGHTFVAVGDVVPEGTAFVDTYDPEKPLVFRREGGGFVQLSHEEHDALVAAEVEGKKKSLLGLGG